MKDISLKHFVIVLIAMTIASANAVAQVKVYAQVESNVDIYVGQRFTYHIIIDGENKPGKVDLSGFEKYNPLSEGNRDFSQTSISIVNGKTTQNVVKRYIMSYSLVSNSKGQIKLDPVKVVIDGKTYLTNSVQVNVLQPGTTDKLDLEVYFSTQKCYVGQPVLMTIKFYFAGDISDPQFDVPVFRRNEFDFDNPEIIAQGVKEHNFGSSRSLLYSQHRVKHKGRDSNLLIMRKIVIPKISGAMKLKPLTISADVAVGRVRDSFFGYQNKYKRFLVASLPLELNVLPLPEKDKPKEFYGLIGEYSILAQANPTEDVYMGDPITLTIKIGGNFLKPVEWPDLESTPEFAANFKIPSQKASPQLDKQNRQKVFTQTIRPDNNKANVIPAIPLAFFDTQTGKYSVIKTKPIKLDLKPSKRLTTADIEGKDFAPVNKEIEAIKQGLSANYENPEVLKNMTFSPTKAWQSPVYALIWSGPFGLLIFSIVVKILTRTSPEKIIVKKRRQACGKAIAQINKITSTARSQHSELAVSAMKQYIGDKFNRIARSLTGNDCYETIIEATGDNEIAEQYKQVIEQYESSRYASMDINIDSQKTKDMINLIKIIEKKSKK